MDYFRWLYKQLCVYMQYMSFEHYSVTLIVITQRVSNAYCIINYRLHTSWQCWRGTKSTPASQPRLLADRCWWLLNQIWLPVGSSRCVCVCVVPARVCDCVYANTLYGVCGYFFICVFTSIYDEIARHSLGFYPLWKVPSAHSAGSACPLRMSHQQPDIKWFVSFPWVL